MAASADALTIGSRRGISKAIKLRKAITFLYYFDLCNNKCKVCHSKDIILGMLLPLCISKGY